MSELKPCPFCGGEAEIRHQTDPDAVVYFARCNLCGTKSIPFLSVDSAIKRWNTRHERTCHVINGLEPYCSECGEVIGADQPYCSECGAKVVRR